MVDSATQGREPNTIRHKPVRQGGEANTSPPCSRCGKDNDREGQRYCKPCHTEYVREWREKRRKKKKK